MENKEKKLELSTFKKLKLIKCNVEKKGRFNYISWAEAWDKVKSMYPKANYKVYENEKGFPAFVNKLGGFVKVGVTINELEHIEFYPITDNYNKSIPMERIDTFAINTAIKRALVKACGLHGLGLYVYMGEDLPIGEEE